MNSGHRISRSISRSMSDSRDQQCPRSLLRPEPAEQGADLSGDAPDRTGYLHRSRANRTRHRPGGWEVVHLRGESGGAGGQWGHRMCQNRNRSRQSMRKKNRRNLGRVKSRCLMTKTWNERMEEGGESENSSMRLHSTSFLCGLPIKLPTMGLRPYREI
jgi:hypothetical protein